MPLLDRFKNLFRGQQPSAQSKKSLPSVVEYGVNPLEFWTVLGDLGDGAFGKVEKVCNKENPRQLAAAKGIEIEQGEVLEDFLVEIEILSQCKHENIVGLLACYFYDNKLSMMLEFCGGGAVDSIMIELEKSLTESQIAYVTRNVCNALAFLHSHFVIHRDLKAGNILLTTDARIKLADFGVSAKMKDRNEKRDSFIGTPYWMAPEVMTCETFKDQPYDCLADIWSLGITLIEMAQMDPPNYQISPMRVVIKIQKSDPPTLDQPSKWSKTFNEFIAKCLVKDPNYRSTAEELLKHEFIKDAVDKRPLVQLLCEKNAELIQEEEVMAEDGASVDESAPESEDQGSEFEAVNRKTEPKHVETTLNASIQASAQVGHSGKKFAAPKPPEVKQQKYFGASTEELRATKPATVSAQQLSSPLPSLKIDENESQPDGLSPSGREAIEILDDLYNVLDGQSMHGGSSTPSTSTPNWPPKHEKFASSISPSQSAGLEFKSQPNSEKLSRRHFSIDNDSLNKNFGLNEKMDRNSGSNTHPTQSIRQVARNSRASLPSPNSPSPLASPGQGQKVRSLQKEGRDIAINRIITNSADNIYEPVRLRVNDDQDEHANKKVDEICARFEITSRPESQSSDDQRHSIIAGDIPQGLVKRNLEIVQHEQLADHAKNDAQIIKDQRRKEDAMLFGEQPSAQVSKIAASFTVRPPRSPSFGSKTKTMVQIRSSDPTAAVSQNDPRVKEHEISQRPVSMPPQSPPQGSKHAVNAQSHSSTPSGDFSESKNEFFDTQSKRAENGNGYAYEHISANNGSPVKGNSFDRRSQGSSSYSMEIPPPEPPVDYDQAPRHAPQNIHRGMSQDSRRRDSASSSPQKGSDDVRARKSSHGGIPTPQSGSFAPGNAHRTSSQHGLGIPGPASHVPPPVSGGFEAAAFSKKSPQRATVTKKTRTYVVDGVEVTSTTLHVLGVKQDFELRKKEMQDLKRMQREEARQQQELNSRHDQLREQQERKFAFEKQAVLKAFEGDIEAISRIQKKKMEEMERVQEEDLRNVIKRIRIDQEHRLRIFKEGLRHEQKNMKQEVDMLPKKERKEAYRQRKEFLDKLQLDQEAKFIVQLEREQEIFLNRAREDHREKMAQMERKFLEQKHQLERQMESAMWELEERQLADKHQLLTQQFRDIFHLQRTHMLARHHKEQEHIKKINQANEENLLRALTTDRKGLPKALRNESKTRSIMFKESLRIDLPDESVERWAQKIHEFEEKEKQRIRKKMDEYDLKCKRKMAQLMAYNQNVLKELEEIHNEKRNMLVDNERAKLAEYENEYQQLLQEWKTSLPTRKMALESKFSEEVNTQERFYGIDNNSQQKNVGQA
ncbi:protein kinase domain-containing protein [Ditylenchus destructor]|uniref:Protein kinase domain-containing protein n=1 Tax=Ditylenchus destructor TaxID=166010 RepID=A0AAD4N438_9BILA|nr:protein kinase domain-containing protein [Ditylenchus destructor]